VAGGSRIKKTAALWDRFISVLNAIAYIEDAIKHEWQLAGVAQPPIVMPHVASMPRDCHR
jgi:hypothetical protein